MKFLSRMALLLRADAHGMLDQLEERSLLLKQHLREAELELAHKRARAETLEEEARRLYDEVTALEGEVRALDEDVELALSRSEEELARFSVRKLLPRRQSLEALRARSEEIATERGRLDGVLQSQEREFAELKRRVQVQLAAVRNERGTELGEPSATVADEEVELELLRRRVSAEGA